MKLYACPSTCSLAPHIALLELGLDHEFVPVDLLKGQGQAPQYLAKNPLGAVPLLELDSGQVLTEAQVILQYLADQKPELKLAPAAGDPERYRLQQWLSLISTELHKSFYPLFFGKRIHSQPEAAEELARHYRERLNVRWQVVSDRLADQPWLMGQQYTVADIYLFVVLTWWVQALRLPLDHWPNLGQFMQRMLQRPAVQAALQREKIHQPA
jgi:glutathione S-transferase